MSQSNSQVVTTSTSSEKATERLQNQVFKGDPSRSRFNACVGDNGNPDIYYYADGFSQATFALIGSVVDNYSENPIDTFIYPICFNLRHSVELYLKALWDELCALANIKRKPIQQFRIKNKEVNVLKVHDISVIWRGIKTNAINLDVRFKSIINNLEPLILCIHEVDPTGQTFRYSYDMETKDKHLVPVSLINILNLKESFDLINKYIHELRVLSGYLIYEYSMNTFTNKLNREDISNISSMLPPRSMWQDCDFDTIKREVMARYGIGARELSLAVNFILRVHDFSASIQLEHKPLGLSEDDILKFVDIWRVKNDLNEWREQLQKRLVDDENHGIEYYQFTSRELVRKVLANLDGNKESFDKLLEYATPRNISGLMALLECRGCLFSEEYVIKYNNHLSYLKRKFEQGGGEWRTVVENVWDESLNSKYCLEKIIKVLRNLNMPSSAQTLEGYCMVEGLIP
ncbi:hypothetical protein JFQ93_001323 [Aeromonas sobria]|nr:hypothetical protein [Aeromonas sobria]